MPYNGATITTPHYVNENKSDIRGIKPGWYASRSYRRSSGASEPSRVEDRTIIARLIARPELGAFVLLVAEIIVFWAINPFFLSPQNISNTLVFTVELGLIALAMTLLMTSGEFDLSVGRCSASRRY